MNSALILHHYPQSPVAEKVRVVLGIKDLSWHSVHIPRIPPKPDLIPLTGGYRRTPVLQIGAEIFCDSHCIIRELERRFPEPTLFPDNNAAVSWALARWLDGPLFTQSIAVVLGAAAESLPADFAADRGRLYFGADFDLDRLNRDVPHLVAQLTSQIHWINQILDGRDFVHGKTPGLLDALCYYLVWFLRGRFSDGPILIDQFSNLVGWRTRMETIGHGTQTDMSSKSALEIARISEPVLKPDIDQADPQPFRGGQMVSVVPEGDGGDPPVTGELLCLNREAVSVHRHDSELGDIVVHFPRVGFRIS